MTWDNILFYCVFIGQIFLISYYFPEKVLGRMRALALARSGVRDEKVW